MCFQLPGLLEVLGDGERVPHLLQNSSGNISLNTWSLGYIDVPEENCIAAVILYRYISDFEIEEDKKNFKKGQQ